MESKHRIVMEDARHMPGLEDQSIDLVVTSPPYPMIGMWDGVFSTAEPAVATALGESDEERAFETMHLCLDGIWQEVHRVLKPGGIACINIGDATRSSDGRFRLFPNHARIILACRGLGFSLLPMILWRKATNAPTKFMGSGMLPPGAYVTLEHEYILILRKGPKRIFSEETEKQNRRESAYFWEERNTWFSDLWFNLPGTPQALMGSRSRDRSAAFPLEIPYRLINMFSVKGDTVLDPFLGTGTTMLAAMCSARNCIGYEIDAAFQPLILKSISVVPDLSADLAGRRLAAHMEFVQLRMNTKNDLKYTNRHYGFPVMTVQEEELILDGVREVRYLSNEYFKVIHAHWPINTPQVYAEPFDNRRLPSQSKNRQLRLF
jgi:modification methylase